MTWEELDWAALDRLRETFLTGAGRNGPYWTSRGDLASYDFTFAERIGWKWDAVLRELRLRGWRPPAQSILDWGCGSGVAGRRVLRFFGAENFTRLVVHDHSPLAADFATEEARRLFPSLAVERATMPFLHSSDPVGVLVISHVLNELSAAARQELTGLIARAQTVLWVEPGSSAEARSLVVFRENLRPAFRVVAPCTHQNACGLLAPENAPHWCHHFAAPPPGIFTDSGWMKFARRAGIDLRSLPYSFLALDRAPAGAGERVVTQFDHMVGCELASQRGATSAPPTSEKAICVTTGERTGGGFARVLGEPRLYKGFAKLLGCDADGVFDLMLQKRDDPAFFKKLKNHPVLPLYRWKHAAGRIASIEPFEP